MASEKDEIVLLDTPLKRIKYMREASIVERCHREPVLGSYNVGQHTFGMLTILREIEPEAPSRIFWSIVGHDLPERSIGDFPATSKWFGLINEEKCDDVEIGIWHGLNFPYIGKEDEYWYWTIKAIDLLELYYFCKDQIAFGNSNLNRMRRRIEGWFEENSHKIPARAWSLVTSSIGCDWDYMPELSDDISE